MVLLNEDRTVFHRDSWSLDDEHNPFHHKRQDTTPFHIPERVRKTWTVHHMADRFRNQLLEVEDTRIISETPKDERIEEPEIPIEPLIRTEPFRTLQERAVSMNGHATVHELHAPLAEMGMMKRDEAFWTNDNPYEPIDGVRYKDPPESKTKKVAVVVTKESLSQMIYALLFAP